MKTEILRILRNEDDYVSGQSICERLQVSRTAVWKCINQLKEEGYEFDAVSNRGYRIVRYPDVVTAAEVESQLREQDLIRRVAYYTEVDSTNNEAKRCAEAGAASGTLFVAESQNGGRGRRGRNWVSPVGSGVWMSLLLRPKIRPADAPMLTLVAAMAVAVAVTEVLGPAADCVIKWPNDLVLGKKKICGILTEMSADPDWVNFVVIGIGINVNIENFPPELEAAATSLLLETGRTVKRSALIAAFARWFSGYFKQFMQTCDFSGLAETYEGLLANKGQQVSISDGGAQYTGKALGIDRTGALLVEKADGAVVRVLAGEVSVRGLYGYV